MQQKHNRLNLSRYTIGTLVLLIVAAVSATALLQHKRTDAVPPAKPAVGAMVPSDFSFSGLSGWWQGATNRTSMALFHKSDDGCFTSVEYKTGTVDVAAALQKGSASPDGSAGTTPGAVLTVALQTAAGPQQYQLHQYTLSSVGGEQLMGGLELGYVQLAGGYVKIQGHCNTAAELPATIPALQAIKYGK